MGANLKTVSVVLLYVIVASLRPLPCTGLVPEPRIDEQSSSKYPTLKQYNLISESPSGGSPHGPAEKSSNEGSFEDENRIVISEPYKTLIQTTTRFAVAQSSLTDYVSVDTFMDVVGGASYALSKPSNLGTALKAILVTVVTVLMGAFVVPASLIQSLAAIMRNPEQLMKLEKHLPGSLNELGIISLLNEKTEDLLSRLKLSDSACRDQTICRTGELVRCAFPRASKAAINFISENFSRPKYRSNKYLNAFLTGFIDQNCPLEVSDGGDANSAPTKSCASNFIKSLSVCSPSQKAAAGSSTPGGPKPNYQTIRTPRAQK